MGLVTINRNGLLTIDMSKPGVEGAAAGITFKTATPEN